VLRGTLHLIADDCAGIDWTAEDWELDWDLFDHWRYVWGQAASGSSDTAAAR
jgi:hypothetical protein